MKKFLTISICVLLLVGLIVAPTSVSAAENSSAGVTIHFLNPTAIAVVGDNLFVADNIDTNKSVILSFTVGETQATYRETVEIDGNVTNLSAKGDDGLYAILSNKVIEYTVGNNAKLSQAHEYNAEGELNGFVDAVYGQYFQSDKTEYFLTKQGLYRNSGKVWAEKFSGAASSVAIGDYVYYMYRDSAGKAVNKRYDGRSLGLPDSDVYNNGNGIATQYPTQPIGLFAWGDTVGVFWNNKIHYVELGAECTRPILLDYTAANSSEDTVKIKDVESSDGKLFVLNDKNLIEVYAGAAGKMSRIYSVGSDVVNQAVPSEFTSFTLVRSKGYPANLVFKTTDKNTSISELITDANEYIVLGYSGSEESLYYYVLTNDNHFGWVQKTNSKTVNGKLTDDKLEVINTAVTQNTNVEYVTKFVSLNAVYLYKLPRNVEAFRGETFTQTASTSPEVTVKQRFTEKTSDGETVWYYVSFEVDGVVKTGFVQAKDVGEFAPTFRGNIPVDGDRKINSTLFEAVKLYKFPDKELLKDDDNLVKTDDSPNGVKLYSGQRVRLISDDGEFAFIQISYSNGQNVCGYVLSNRLIGVHAITTNAIVGLTLLAAAIALATVLIVVFVKRKNGALPRRKKATKD